MIPIFSSEAVLAAIDATTAIERTRFAFERHVAGDWEMPPKVYVEAPPGGDFRAMPARGDGLALLKWVTSFPDNPKRGLPVVTGVIMLSDSETGEELAIIDCQAVTSLRTGAAAALSAQLLASPEASSVGVIGCGVNGAWAARCLAAAGYGDGVCSDVRADAAQKLASQLGWRRGAREEAASQDVVVTVTPGSTPVLFADDLHAGQHVAALGADAAGKAEVERAALRHARLFCDEWQQASGGGELSGGVQDGVVRRAEVTEIGDVLTGKRPGRRSKKDITLFDSTGLAIQDLAIASAVLDAYRDNRISAQTVVLR